MDPIKSHGLQTRGFTSFPTASVILGKVLSITTCGSRTHTEVTVCNEMPNLLAHKATEYHVKSKEYHVYFTRVVGVYLSWVIFMSHRRYGAGHKAAAFGCDGLCFFSLWTNHVVCQFSGRS